MATPPGGGGEVPQAGYYPDPSIPGYIRFWNGGAWVPGTSRPAPKEGEALPAPPVSVAPQLAPSPAPAPSVPAVPAVEETGPVFLDEDPASAPAARQEPASARQEPASARQEPASAWQASTDRQTGFGGERDQRVSWGSTPDPRDPRAAWPTAEPGGAADAPDASGPNDARAALPGGGPASDRPNSAAEAPAWPAAAGQSGTAPAPAEPSAGPARQAADGRGAVAVQGTAAPAPAPAADTAAPAPAGTAGGPGAVPAQGPGAASAQAHAGTAAPVWPAAGQADDRDARPQGDASAGLPGQRPGAATGSARLGGMPVTPAPAAASWTPQTAQAPAPQTAAQPPAQQAAPHPGLRTPGTPGPQPAPTPAPLSGSAPATASAQQPQAAEAQPVIPWKPPVEDVFMAAARAQAAARPAGLGRRLMARLVDGVVLGALVGAASYPFLTAAVTHIDEKIEAAKQSGVTVQVWLVDSTTSVQFGIVLAAFLVLGALYEALPTAKWGRTLGKKLCGIEVRDIEAHEPPTFGAALRRWLVYAVLGLLGIGLLNVLWCLVDRPWRQCWHDKAARTFVAR
ncbi:RDD family protein [Streptomyces sp. NPDC056632]|uniref:RDD family protein n=1 Tax=Streptomyces sp. NPDC056632 TaxID=3345884 RepID=UPI0036979737